LKSLKPRILSEPSLVGREKELEQLQSFLASASARKGKTAFISGEAGCGKTRLSNEFLEIARNKGVAVLVGWCLSNAAIPFFPFVEAFDSYLSENEDVGQGAISHFIGLKSWLIGTNKGKDNQKFEAITPQVWRDQSFAAVAKDLLNLSNNKPLILFLDDIHWADSASLALLHYLSRTIDSERIFILATFRSEELHSSVEGQPNSLVETLRLMGRENLFSEIKLLNLSAFEVAKIAEDMLSGKIQFDFAQKLAVESRGNPLFLVESLRLLYEQGSLVQESGQWSVSVETLGMPTKVKDIILRRLSVLKSEQRRVLDAASVIGDKFDPELLGAVLDNDSLRVLEVLNEIAHSNSLVCCEEDYFRFDHAKSRDVLYEEIFPPLRQGYHSRIAEKIESKIKSLQFDSFGDLAYHYARAGNKEKSIKYALAAGEDALSRFSNLEAVKHFSYVLQTGTDLTDFSKENLIAQEGLGDAYFAMGMFDNAINAFEKIITTQSGVPCLRAYRKTLPAAFWRGELRSIVHVKELANKIRQYITLDALEASRLLMWKGKCDLWEGAINVGIQELEQSLRVFEENNSLLDIANALFELAHIYALEQQSEEAISAALRSIALYEEIGDIRGQMNASLWGAIVFGHHCGFIQEAISKYAVSIRIAEKIGDFITLAWLGLYHGALLESLGEYKAAIDTSLRGLNNAEKANSIDMLRMNRASLIRQYAKLGDLEKAEEYFKSLEKDFPDNKNPRNTQAQAVAIWSKGVFFAGKNRWMEANECFENSLNLVKTTLERIPLEAWIEEDYAKILSRQERKTEARMFYEKACGLDIKYKEIESRLAKNNLQVYCLADKEVELEQSFQIRLNVINISKSPAVIVQVEGIISPESKLVSFPSNCRIQKDTLLFDRRQVDPFQVENLPLVFRATKPGVLSLNPKVVYLNTTGERIISKSKSINLTVKPASTKNSETVIQDSSQPVVVHRDQIKCEFKAVASSKTFEFLISSFISDYMHQQMSSEKSGWRTLTEIIKGAKISKFSVYGTNRRKGRVLVELEGRWLVEVRVFYGERERGGRITKARICYEKDPVRHLVEQRLLKNK
jgi:pentatricopeptide repeat protein